MKLHIKVFAVIVLGLALNFAAQGQMQDDKDHHDQHKEGEQVSSFPELDKFHQLLHTIWHENYPKNQWTEIRAQREELVRRKDAVMNTQLHVKPENKGKAEELRSKFGQAVDRMAAAAKSGTDQELKKAVSEMHESFEQFADSVG